MPSDLSNSPAHLILPSDCPHASASEPPHPRQPHASAAPYPPSPPPARSATLSDYPQHPRSVTGAGAGGAIARDERATMTPSASPAAQGGAGAGEQRKGKGKEPQTETAKVDQLVHHFYGKTVAVLSQSRMTHLLDSDPSSAPSVVPAAGTTGSTSSVSTVAGGMVPGGAGARKVSGASTGGGGKGKGRTNKWFNLDLPDSPLFRDELRTWRSVSSLLTSSSAPSPTSSHPCATAPSPAPSPTSSHPCATAPSPAPSPSPHSNIPALVLETILDVSDLTPNQVLVLQSSPSAGPYAKRIRVDPSFAAPPSPAGGPGVAIPRSGRASRTTSPPPVRSPASASGRGSLGGSNAPTVVLERWVLSLLPSPSSPSSSSSAAAKPPPDLPDVYKHSILHFRSLFTLARALPSYSLHRRLAKRRAGVGGAGLKIGVRLSAGTGEDEGGEGEVGVEVPIEEREGEGGMGEGGERGRGRTTEKITFPGVMTPFGILSLTCTYRLNASFAVEEIETLLSSRFIDEDFFRPTVAATRYSSEREKEKEDAARPGSLPISSGIASGYGAGHGEGAVGGISPARASPPAGTVPRAGEGMTGFAPLPSYGSLSSRHQYAPSQPHPYQHAPSPLSTSPARFPLPPSPAAPVPVPLPASTSTTSATPTPANPSSLSNSSSRFSAYAPPGTSAGGAVEPAFISLSRARGSSFAATAGSGIARASPSPVPLSSSPSGAIVRRTSLTNSSGVAGGSQGSPIFRPGSYFSSATPAVGAGGLSSSPSPSYYSSHSHSYSYGGGPPSRQQPLPTTTAGSNASSSPASQLVFGSRSPLVPAVPHSGPSMLGATAPSSVTSPSSQAGVGVGIAIGGASSSSMPGGGVGGSGGTPSSSSLGRGGAGPFAFGSTGTGAGSYTSRSYGRGSSGSGGGGAYGEGWGAGGGGSESPQPIGAPGLVRRASSRLSFSSGYGPPPGVVGSYGAPGTSGGRSSSRLAQIAAAREAAEQEPKKRFLQEGKPDDAGDIEAFLGMLESKPDLRGGGGSILGASFALGGGAGSTAGRLSKKDVDEQMKALRSSVLGFGGGGGGSDSPSPPSFGLAGGAGGGPRVGPGGLSGISSLRKQTSRLSIEEDAVGEQAAHEAAKERERERDPSSGGSTGEAPSTASTKETTTPRGTLRSLSGATTVVSPSLSATSSSTVIPPLPPLSSLGSDAHVPTVSLPPPSSRFSVGTGGIEPRFLPLPTSSTTSPLASPGVHRGGGGERDLLSAFAFSTSGGPTYPPLPYPPAATTTTSTSTEPITFAPYILSRVRSSSSARVSVPRAHAVRQPLPARPASAGPGLGLGRAENPVFTSSTAPLHLHHPQSSTTSFSTAASNSGFGDVEQDVEAALASSSSFRADDGEVEAVGRLELDDSLTSSLSDGCPRGRRWGGVGASEGGESALATAAAAAQAQASRDSTPAAAVRGVGYFGAPSVVRRRPGEETGDATSPPEISWMG
ncbi:hypothetical protein JCM8547_007533 [Rhodosporidiobolus lusitaniae]